MPFLMPCEDVERSFLSFQRTKLSRLLESVCVCVCVCVFGFNVAFNDFSVISGRCLVVAGSSMLSFIVLPH